MTVPPNGDVSNDDILQAARGGDDAAFSELIERAAPLLRSDLERRSGAAVKRYTSMADLEQDVLTRVQGMLAQLTEASSWSDFEALIHTHARWAVHNAARSRRRFDGESVAGSHAMEAGADRRPDETGHVTRADEAAWLRGQLEALPPELADVTRMRLEGASFAEIAERLGVSEATARRRFLEAARTLKPSDS